MDLLPASLCKYKGIGNESQLERVLDIVEKNRLYLSSVKQLNDPMEGFMVNFSISAYAGIGIPLSVGCHPEPLEECFARMRVVSLTKSYYSPQMWAHYAQGYKGACVCFGVKGALAQAKRIQYINTKISTDLIDSWIGKDSLSEAVMTSLFYKQRDWSYENEWRIVIEKESKNEYLQLKDCDIRGLIVGQSCKPQYRQRLVEVCKSKDIPVYTTYTSGSRNPVEIVPIDFEVSLDGCPLEEQIQVAFEKFDVPPIKVLMGD